MRNPSTSTTTATTTKPTPCCSKVGLKRGPWTPDEDEKLSNYISKDGEGRWRTLPKRAWLLRCGKSCRLRWMNYLRPCVKRGQIASDEEDLILRLHRLLGNRWSLIAGRIPGRTDNEIKNYWNTHLSKKLITQGIDPRTHKPLSYNPNQTNDDDNNDIPKLSSSTKPQNVHVPTSPKPNQMIISSTLDGIYNHKNVYFDNNTNLVDDQAYPTGTNGDYEDDINYCTDDVFSSFLNSLINEDVFVGQPQQGILLPPQDAPGTDDLISPGHAFGFSATGWDENANIIMWPTFNQINDPNKFEL